jgi:hypothetical protein
MTNYEIVKILQEFRVQIREHYAILAQLRMAAGDLDSVMEPIGGIAAFDGKQGNHLSILQDRLHLLHAKLTLISTREFFENTMELAMLLENVMVAIPSFQGPVLKLVTDLNELQDFYDKYTRNHSTENVFRAVTKAQKFTEALDLFEMLVDATCLSLIEGDESPDDSKTLSIYLPATLNFQEFISRLNLINLIYDELCQIFDVSISEHPLKIIKVESGSLWVKIFGSSKVIALMDDILRGFAKYIHRNYTKEGKIAAIPTTLKTMDEVLSFSNKLQAAGVDVTEIHEQLAKGALVMTKSVNLLYSNQPSVVINGETVSLAADSNRTSIEHRNIPRLSSNDLEPQ